VGPMPRVKFWVLPTRVKFWVLPTRVKFRVLPTRVKFCVLPTRVKFWVLPTRVKFRVLPTRVKFRVLPTRVKFWVLPTRVKFWVLPTRVKFRVLPTRVKFCTQYVHGSVLQRAGPSPGRTWLFGADILGFLLCSQSSYISAAIQRGSCYCVVVFVAVVEMEGKTEQVNGGMNDTLREK